MSYNTQAYDGGLTVSAELKRILDQPGLITTKKGGQQAHTLYRNGTVLFNPRKLSPFGLICYLGALDAVKEAVESGQAPPLSNTETPYKLGYATLVLFGAVRLVPNQHTRHLATLEYLVGQKLPIDIADIAGWTALSHAAMAGNSQPKITKALLEAGANPDYYQDRYGDVPLTLAIQQNNYEDADLLLQYNADIDIPEPHGFTPRTLFTKGGPKIAAVFHKHIQKREGQEEAPRIEKRCDNCRKTDVPLRNCSKCQVARYCGVECQRAAWPMHKKTCQPFGATNTVTFKPDYKIVREKGVGGLKAYFAAELKSKDELVVKVSEVLAAQPF